MHYSSSLEYLVESSYTSSYSNINYFSKNIVYNHGYAPNEPVMFNESYFRMTSTIKYKPKQEYSSTYTTNHLFTPEIFLNASRPNTRFVVGIDGVKSIVEENFQLMMKEKLPGNISINILPFDEFKSLHSIFGVWNNGILGFSINNIKKEIFVRENHLDVLMIVIGHEIGHVMTPKLANKHDEEAKAFAFSIEWAKTIKEHDVANLGLSIKNGVDFEPARNGLHDVAFSFVDFMVKKGRKAIGLHNDLARNYISIFNIFY